MGTYVSLGEVIQRKDSICNGSIFGVAPRRKLIAWRLKSEDFSH
ncbi:hypothetical protein ES703_45372 [subsurface metagenome]